VLGRSGLMVSASVCGVRGHLGSNITADSCSLGHGLRLTGAYGQLSLVSLHQLRLGKGCHLCRVAGNTVWSNMASEFLSRRGRLLTKDEYLPGYFQNFNNSFLGQTCVIYLFPKFPENTHTCPSFRVILLADKQTRKPAGGENITSVKLWRGNLPSGN